MTPPLFSPTELQTILSRGEGQFVDFKPTWDHGTTAPKPLWRRALPDNIADVVAAFANADRGLLVIGVDDDGTATGHGYANEGVGALFAVPHNVSVDRLGSAVCDCTDPRLTPVFEELTVPEGTGRLILMLVHACIPPYTDTARRGTIGVRKDCKPLTGTRRTKLPEESGQHGYSAGTIYAPLPGLVSPAAMEALREAAKADRDPADLLRLGDIDLLQAIGVVRDGRPTRAAVLLAGSPDVVRDHIPGFVWTHPTRFCRVMHPKCANPRFLSHFRPETYQRKADLEHFDTFLAHSGWKCIGSGFCSAYRRRIGEWT